MKDKVFIGTSGFYYFHWIGKFYPEDLPRNQVLTFYSQHFNTVEINSSFYHFPRKTTVQNWVNAVTENFVFSFKMHKSITYLKKLKPEMKLLDKFFSSLEPVKNKKTLILIQLPASFKKDLQKLEIFTKLLPENFFFAFEFRHISWFENDVYEILKKRNIAIVLADSPIKKGGSTLWPKKDVETANFCYIRFHGSKSLYRSSYSKEELKTYAQLITQKVKKGLQVFAYFNNDAEGHAVENAKMLKEFLNI